MGRVVGKKEDPIQRLLVVGKFENHNLKDEPTKAEGGRKTQAVQLLRKKKGGG